MGEEHKATLEPEMETPSLFDQTKGLAVMGERLSGDPEVLHEIQDMTELPIAREQIKTILRCVPDIFPEDWQSPEDFKELSDDQKRTYFEINKNAGIFRLTGPDIQTIIELGIAFRETHGPGNQ